MLLLTISVLPSEIWKIYILQIEQFYNIVKCRDWVKLREDVFDKFWGVKHNTEH